MAANRTIVAKGYGIEQRWNGIWGVVAKRGIKEIRGRPQVLIGIIILTLFILVGIFGPMLAPYDPYKQDLRRILQGINKEHYLGTDAVGRDILSRLLHGARNSLIISLGAVGMSVIVGGGLGLLAGYFGGLPDRVLMRLTDTLLGLPPLFVSLALASVSAGGKISVILAIGAGLTPAYLRIIRGVTINAKAYDYVLAAEALGARWGRIIMRHILPNCVPVMIVQCTLNLGTAMLIEGSLSFLGLGIRPPEPAWGSMVYEGRGYMERNPVFFFAPGLAIMLVVFGFNMVGDWLRDVVDPKMRGKSDLN
jgi:ABC-type dipeptide/oligopeptide/nickel transport system permease subunit